MAISETSTSNVPTQAPIIMGVIVWTSEAVLAVNKQHIYKYKNKIPYTLITRSNPDVIYG